MKRKGLSDWIVTVELGKNIDGSKGIDKTILEKLKERVQKGVNK